MGENLTERELKGLAVSKGVVHGEAYVMLHRELETPVYEIQDADKPAERKRFEDAILKTRTDILQLKAGLAESVGEAEAAIFDAQLLVLEDVAIMQETIATFESEHYNIEYCYSSTINKFIKAFEKIDDAFIRERIADLKDVSRRLISNMLGIETVKIGAYTDPLVLVSRDFAPSDFALVEKSKILAIVSERGSQTSHTAILSRSLGVPCIVGAENVANSIQSGEFLLVDGYNGKIIVNPTNDTLRKYTEIESEQREIQKIYDTSLPFPSITPDGMDFKIKLNINSAEDIPAGSMNYCDGVGLLRTENFFLDTGGFPDEDQQFEVYKAVALASKGKPVTIRTLDLGGDKNFNLMKEVHKEENPFMGYRAIRFCLNHTDLFSIQLKAILRASAYGKIRIMLPMINSIREVEKSRLLIEKAKEELLAANIAFDKNIQVGAMIEVPSAALTADVICDACDFISIGTNDLIQYILAVDRVNDMVAHLYEPMHPAVVRIIDMVVSAARKAEIPVSVCGELAADPLFAPLLLGMGVSEFSMSPTSVNEIKFLLRKTTYEKARNLRNEILAQKRSRHIVKSLRSFHYESMQPYMK